MAVEAAEVAEAVEAAEVVEAALAAEVATLVVEAATLVAEVAVLVAGVAALAAEGVGRLDRRQLDDDALERLVAISVETRGHPRY